MKMRLSAKKLLISFLLGSLTLMGLGLLCLALLSYLSFEQLSKAKLYSQLAEVPHRHVGLVLGTSKYVRSGYPNLYFNYRMEAASQLYFAGKVDYLLISGDNAHRSYNEPIDMFNALIAYGIPEERIYLDYAGFRTLDSLVRAKEVFGLDELTIISQHFHNKRAIFLAEYAGIDAIAFDAKDVPYASSTKKREILARVKALLDVYILDTQPRFLGEAIAIPSDLP